MSEFIDYQNSNKTRMPMWYLSASKWLKRICFALNGFKTFWKKTPDNKTNYGIYCPATDRIESEI